MSDSFSFSDVLDEAVAISAGEQATAADVISARRSMHLLLISWKNRGFNTWRITNKVYSLSTDGVVSLPRRVDDVFQVNSNNPIGGCSTLDFLGAQATMRRISADEYALLTTKGTLGRPSQYYLERTEPPKLRCYPIGRPNITESVEVWFIERPAEFDRYSNQGSDSVPQRWLVAMVSGVAYFMSRKRPGVPEEKILRLKGDYEEDLDQCTRNDRQRTSLRVRTGVGRGSASLGSRCR